MTTETAPTGMKVTGILKAVTPKAVEGTDGYGNSATPKANKLQLMLEITIPKPQPPRPFEQWEDPKRWERDRAVDEIRRKLQKQLEDLKPPAKAHFYANNGESTTCTGHKKCGREEPDGKECIDAETYKTELKGKLQTQLDAAAAKVQNDRQADYAQYVERCIAQTRDALSASLGTGLFFALLNQEVEVTFAPSSRLFQPLLDLSMALPAQINIPLPALPASANGQSENLDQTVYDDGSDDELTMDEEDDEE